VPKSPLTPEGGINLNGMVSITGNFTVNSVLFADWFEQERRKNLTLFPHALDKVNFEAVMKELKKMMCKGAISLEEFVGIFCFIGNETAFTYKSLKELGGASHYAAHGYSEKEAGRGLIQLTSASVYRVVLAHFGKNYDQLSSAELDALFLQKEIYLKAVCIYISHPHLAGNHWKKVQQGQFYEFGVAISGGATWYGTLYANRCNFLLKALQNASIKNVTTVSSSFVWVVALGLVVLCLLLYALYRYGQKNSAPLSNSPSLGNSSGVLPTT
jgi:hypothetical protein